MRTLYLLVTMMAATALLSSAGEQTSISEPDLEDECSGYMVNSVSIEDGLLTAELELREEGCALYGPDVQHLSLTVEYQTRERLHVLIQDRAKERYRVPDDIFPPPPVTDPPVEISDSLLRFRITSKAVDSFAFKIFRQDTKEVIFDTTGTHLIFKRQFLRVRTLLPPDPNIYGLGEHSDSFRLPTKNYTRTLWNRDAGAIPEGENLYGSHPVYFEHRKGSTHGVLLMNSNGMDVVIDEDEDGWQWLEYRATGGVLDFYFMAGPDPVDVARQYAEVVGRPAMVPYWSLGFHQCKFGYRDWFEVAEVVHNYSEAGIPLETMWTDIDYMDHRRVFSLDPKNYPLHRMQDLVKYLHGRDQKYIMMIDPAVGKSDYSAYTRGKEMDIFMKTPEGKDFEGVVWPGVTVFPDWYHENGTNYWVEMFDNFFSPETGIDIDGVWIDMNEPASFCPFPCDAQKRAEYLDLPPAPPTPRKPPYKIPGFPESGEHSMASQVRSSTRKQLTMMFDDNVRSYDVDHTGDNLLYPPYKIHNHAEGGELGDQTMHPDVKHANGLVAYDTHNIYGALMSAATRKAMLARRPGLKPFIVTRSTFAGSGRSCAKWLGDNVSSWKHYRASIPGLLAFSSMYAQPLTGSDVCGFLEDATVPLCARWTTLGAFQPFFRNHAVDTAISQEFYRWPIVASAARWAIDVRYRMLDYFYTALQRQSDEGTPAVSPLFFHYPRDERTFGIDMQYFHGHAVMVAPVTEEGEESVRMYLPDDLFYEWESGHAIKGHGEWVTLKDIPLDRIPLFVKGGSIIPLRVEGAMTTTNLRKKNFELLVAPDVEGKATGELYFDDGVSLDGGDANVRLKFTWDGDTVETEVIEGQIEDLGVSIERVKVLGDRGFTKGYLEERIGEL